jgi:starvation-inducible DNA-binding protein
MKPNIGIKDQDRQAVVNILNTLLSDEFVLYAKTRNYHWNVTGPQFHDFHKFFEAQYEELDEVIDEVAERARALGGAEFLKQTRLAEEDAAAVDAKGMVASLLNDHEAIVRSLRKDLETCNSKHHDAGTSDFLTGLMEKHEKTAWMLRATAESKAL